MTDYTLLLVIIAAGVAVTASAAIGAAAALGRIAGALEPIPGALGAVADSCDSMETPLAGICERYELLTDAQAGPIKRERNQAERRRQEAQWDETAEKIRRGEITLGGEDIPDAPKEREAWLAKRTAGYRDLWDKMYGPPDAPAGS